MNTVELPKTCQENLVLIYLNFLVSIKITFSSVLEEKFYLLTQHILIESLLCARDCIVFKNAKKGLLKDERGSEKQRDYYISKNHIGVCLDECEEIIVHG